MRDNEREAWRIRLYASVGQAEEQCDVPYAQRLVRAEGNPRVYLRKEGVELEELVSRSELLQDVLKRREEARVRIPDKLDRGLEKYSKEWERWEPDTRSGAADQIAAVKRLHAYLGKVREPLQQRLLARYEDPLAVVFDAVSEYGECDLDDTDIDNILWELTEQSDQYDAYHAVDPAFQDQSWSWDPARRQDTEGNPSLKL